MENKPFIVIDMLNPNPLEPKYLTLDFQPNPYIRIKIRQIGLDHYMVTVMDKKSGTEINTPECDIFDKSFMTRLKNTCDFLTGGAYD